MNAAGDLIRQAIKSWEETDFSTFSTLKMTSTYFVRNASHHGSKQTTVTTMDYQADPYSIAWKESISAKGGDESNQASNAAFSLYDGSYYVTENGVTIPATEWRFYSTFSTYFDLPIFFEKHGISLLNKAQELLSQIGSQTNPQSNELTGFQAQSNGGDDLAVTFDGTDFGIKDHFFQREYEDANATSFSLHISEGKIRSYKVTFTYEEEIELASSSTPEFQKINQVAAVTYAKEASVENVWDYGA